MKNYTIIYGGFFTRGSHTSSITKMKHITCEPTQLNETVENEVGWSSVWFVFDGHCQQTE